MRTQLEEQITNSLKIALESETQDWYSAKIITAKVKELAWRNQGPTLPRQIRINILDSIRLEQVVWNGSLDQVAFLERIFELPKLPSHDHRFQDAAGDIWQHCINNDDWDPYWLFSDQRFHLLDGPPEKFLAFLCEVVNPMVRPDRDESLKLVKHFNNQLRLVGWEIYEKEHIAGRPRFAYRQNTNNVGSSMMRARTVAESLDAGYMAKQIERMEKSIDTDPELAIGTAKDLVEACCKTILSKRNVPVTNADNLVHLTTKITRELQLVPNDVSDEAKGAENIRLILRNLTQLTNNLAQLRGLYGTGHGRDGTFRGLQPRHARLAVTSAVAFIDFVTETYRYREETKD